MVDRESVVSALEIVSIGPQAATDSPIVFLHEALGSVSHWGDFPLALCEAVDRSGVVYSRRGHGRSAPFVRRHEPDYLHRAAQQELPAVLAARGIERPVLFGHSDGATIALLYAAAFPDQVDSIIVLAPHIFVEDLTLYGIRAAVVPGAREQLVNKLGRHHWDPESVVAAWQHIWLAPGFREWNIEADIASIRCPVLVIQGLDDAYGTRAQVDGIVEQVSRADMLMLPGVGHAPHREARNAVIDACRGFLALPAV